MKILITSLSGGTGKTVLAYNMSRHFSKSLLIDLTSNRHMSVIFNTPMDGSGYQTFQAGHKNIDELIVKSDNISFLPRGAEGEIKYESLKEILDMDGGSYDSIIADFQADNTQKVLAICPLFDIIVVPMRCDVSVKAEVWLLSKLKEAGVPIHIVPVILRNKSLDAKISIAVRVDEKKIRKNLPVNANSVFTVDYDPDVHDKTWQNQADEKKYAKVISIMKRYFAELKKDVKIKN
ncbi:MAG: ParA family protein (plasmid) [Candidatus Methanoperedens sp.]|nr:MAG: ParA family protein [Candidatus Methanoperedens sp.]